MVEVKTLIFMFFGIIVSLFATFCFSSDQKPGVKSVSTNQLGCIECALGSANHADISDKNSHLSAWHPQYQERCYLQDRKNIQTENIETIKELFEFLNRDPVFAKYLFDILREANATVCIDDRADETRGYYDFKYNVIAVRDHLELLEKLVILVHEILHIDNMRKGFCYSLDFAMEEMVRMTFAVEADVQAIVTLFAWHMKEEGYGDVWHTLLRFDKYTYIAEVFENEILASSSEIKATKAAFSQWYKSEWRVDSYFKNTCSIYYDLLYETKYIQKYSKLPKYYFDKLCTLPSGKNYDCHLTNEIQENPRTTIEKARKNSPPVPH